MGLYIGTTGNTVTISCDSNNFEQINAYASIQPRLEFDRENLRLMISVKYNKTKQDKLDGKRGFVPDLTGSMQSFPCTIVEFESNYLFTLAYAKLKTKLEELFGVGKIVDDIL